MENIDDLKEELKNWADEDADDTNNLLHRYFEASQIRHWCSVSDEGSRAYNIMFNEEVERDSPLDALFSGIAAQAAHGVWETVAEAFGLEAKYVHMVLATYEELEPEDARIPPITFEQFMKMYKEEKETWEKEYGNS